MSRDSQDDDSEWEEQEQLVVVHLSGIIDTEYLKKCDAANCKILGIDTEEPILQIDKMLFRGSYDECVGTNILFEEQSEVVNGKVEKTLKYLCHTEKNLDMVRAFFKREEDSESVEIGKGSQGTSEDHNVENKQEDVSSDEVSEFQEVSRTDSQQIEAQMSTNQNEHSQHEDSVTAGTLDADPMDCT